MTNKEISLRTKRSLAAALKSCLGKKSLSKITVTELVTACNINRKTFYYHFQDIYDLLKWMLEQEAIEVVKKFDLIVNAEEAIRFVMDYVDKNKHIINGTLDSMGYEEIKRFFYTDLFSVFRQTIEQGAKELKVTLDPQFRDFLAAFYTEASSGLLLDWIKNKMNQNRETILQDILSIYKISLPAILLEKGIPEKHSTG